MPDRYLRGDLGKDEGGVGLVVLPSLACAVKLLCVARKRIELIFNFFYFRDSLVYPPFFSLSFSSVSVLMVKLDILFSVNACSRQPRV